MDRQAWRARAEDHLLAARTLQGAGQSSVAYYLAGLSVECALKARIAASFRAEDWPSRQFVNDIHSHDLGRLVMLARLEDERRAEAGRDPAFAEAWETTKFWNVDARYGAWSAREAGNMIDAVGGTTGVMAWIRRHW